MHVYVCSLSAMPSQVARLRPGYLVSMVQPEFQPDRPHEVPASRHHRMGVHDIVRPEVGAVRPETDHVQALVEFLRDWPADESMLIHCFAGISRSTAGALIALALHGEPERAGRVLRAAAPHAIPNPRIIELADDLLSFGGRLVAARDAMGPFAAPVAEAPLVSVALSSL